MERVLLAGCVVAGLMGCRTPVCSEQAPSQGGTYTCALPNHDNRDYFLHLPSGFDRNTPLPVVMFFHGGGGRKNGAVRSSCPNGDEKDPHCWTALADRERFILLVPDGTANVLNQRTWNAGGGGDGARCCCGLACERGVDDVTYVRDLLDEVSRYATVDNARVYATGISNGAAMSYRLACELADRITAIAPVGGAAQVATSPGCNPSRPVGVLHVHGTLDPCWPYEGGEDGCLGTNDGAFVSVEDTVRGGPRFVGFNTHNSCSGGSVMSSIPDTADDGTVSVEESFVGCAMPLVLLTVHGGGHTWPDGQQYLSKNRVGVVEKDFNGNERIWQFFRGLSRP